MTLASFLAFAGLTLLAAISPGPAVLMAARTGLSEGFRTGLFLAMGIGSGAVIWAAAAIFGLGIVFSWAPWALWALKIAGAAWLFRMAWRLWRDAPRPIEPGAASPAPRSAASAFRLGLFTQLANPKPVVAFSAIFLGTLPEDTPIQASAALLLVIFANETLWNTLVARIFALERTRAGYISLKIIIDRSFGGALALLGLKVVAT